MNTNNKKRYKTNLPRYFVAGILAIAIVFMWFNNKNKAEEARQKQAQQEIIPK